MGADTTGHKVRRRPHSGKGRVTSREVAAQVIGAWEEQAPAHRPPLEDLTEEVLAGTGPWSAQDRALIREMVFGVVRWLALLDGHLDARLKERSKLPPGVFNHLRVGAYQILFLDRVPARAAVHEAVEAMKRTGAAWAAGLVNAVLRRLAEVRDRMGPGDPVPLPAGTGRLTREERLALETAHPLWMVARWVREFDFETARAMCAANNARPPLTLRVNRRRAAPETVLQALRSAGIDVNPGRFAPSALRLEGYHGSPTELPGFNQGNFQVQDEGAQLVSLALAPGGGELLLDACAGVGGKTTHLAELAGDGTVIEATDPNARRLHLLAENQARLGLTSIRVLPFSEFEGSRGASAQRYDGILVDAPCSGLGVIRRHPDIKWNRSPEGFRALAKVQGGLLDGLAPLARAGGRMVYATCSFEPEETAAVVEDFLRRHPDWSLDDLKAFLPPACHPFIMESGWLSILPATLGPDGFFVARLSRTA